MKSLLLISLMAILTFNINAESIINEDKATSIVKKLYSYDIEEAESMPTRVKFEVEIEVTLLDLNNDKKNEIFAVLQHPYFCGSRGCRTIILEKTPKDNWRSILGGMITHGDIEVFKETTNGYNTINFGDGPKLKYSNGGYAF